MVSSRDRYYSRESAVNRENRLFVCVPFEWISSGSYVMLGYGELVPRIGIGSQSDLNIELLDLN